MGVTWQSEMGKFIEEAEFQLMKNNAEKAVLRTVSFDVSLVKELAETANAKAISVVPGLKSDGIATAMLAAYDEDGNLLKALEYGQTCPPPPC